MRGSVVLSQNHIGKTCPFCQFPLKTDSDCLHCPSCKVPHHRDCWEQNGGCTTFGCKVNNFSTTIVRNESEALFNQNRIVVEFQEDDDKVFKQSLTENFSYRKPGKNRLLAAVIDLIIAIITPVAVHFLIIAVIPIVFHYYYYVSFFISSFTFFLFLFYLLARDSFGLGQSWGKKFCGLMVVRLTDNQPCKIENSLLRNFLLPLFFIEFFVPLANSKGQRLGDMLAKTQVIEKVHYQQ